MICTSPLATQALSYWNAGIVARTAKRQLDRMNAYAWLQCIADNSHFAAIAMRAQHRIGRPRRESATIVQFKPRRQRHVS